MCHHDEGGKQCKRCGIFHNNNNNSNNRYFGSNIWWDFFFEGCFSVVVCPSRTPLPFLISHWGITKYIRQSSLKEAPLECRACDRQQFNQALWHSLLLLLSFCLIDCIYIHFPSESVPKHKSKLIIDIWDLVCSTLTESLHAFWKKQKTSRVLARFKKEKEKASPASFTCREHS